MSDLEKILQEIKNHSENGNRRGLASALRQLMQQRQDYYQHSIAKALEEEYADALYKMLLLEMDEEEEDSIEIAELAYLCLSTALKKNYGTPEHYKKRLLLLHYFGDYFTDSVIEIFLPQYRSDHLLQARNLAMECLEKMQLSDMFYLEEKEPDFINGDEQLSDACNAIETHPDLSEEERTNAALLHEVLYAYLKTKYKN